jgi:hypothetical protein
MNDRATVVATTILVVVEVRVALSGGIRVLR